MIEGGDMHQVKKRKEAGRMWKRQEKAKRRKTRKGVAPIITLREKGPQNVS